MPLKQTEIGGTAEVGHRDLIFHRDFFHTKLLMMKVEFHNIIADDGNFFKTVAVFGAL